MTTNEGIQMGRAKNAVLEFLENRLIVPKIYLDADWGGQNVDVLAIERDGVGDVHAVLLLPCSAMDKPEDLVPQLIRAMKPLLHRFTEVIAQYKYIACILVDANEGSAIPGIPHEVAEESFSPDGLGRVGFLTISSPGASYVPEIQVLLKPERFRAKIAKLADEYVQHHEADWEIRA